jgi:uncharacterized protein
MSRTAIQTYSGLSFDILNPVSGSICIEDIAHSLSQINRFNGHTRVSYSVAEHSVHTASLVREEFKLEALLHDASESILTDIPSPLKGMQCMAGYRDLEKNIQKRCEYTFGVISTEESHAEIKKADIIMLKVEAMRLLRQPLIPSWSQWIEDIELPETVPEIIGWHPAFAESKFLELFNSLYTK